MKPNGSSETERLEAIRSLLLDDEIREIERLRLRIADLETGGKDRVKNHLAGALRELSESEEEEDFKDLTEALQPGTEAAIARSVVEDRSRLSRALFPVMGPAIRDYVTDLFRSLAEELNETIRNTTSLERIKWRFQARLSGKPFAEYLMLKTANFQVKRLLLIDRESGILIDRIARENDGVDADLMSGMLTAIRSFVRDSFADHSDPDKDNELNRFSYGDHQVIIEGGPDMILAAVVEGVAPPAIRWKLREVLENIHQRKNPWLGDGKKDDAEERAEARRDRKALMRPALLENRSSQQDDAGSGGMWRFWVFCGLACALLGGWIAFRYVKAYEWREFIDALNEEAGIQVTTHQTFEEVHGLRDPLATDPVELGKVFNIDPERVTFEFEPFQSLDPIIVAKRGTSEVSRIQAGLAAAQKTLVRQEKEFSEKIEEVTAGERKERLKLVAEVVASNFGHLDEVTWNFDGPVLSVSGEAPSREYSQIMKLADRFPSLEKIDTSGLRNATEVRIAFLEKEIASSPLLYETGATLPIDAVAGIAKLSGWMKELRNEASKVGRRYRFEVTAHPLIGARSDANQNLVNTRADAILNRLVLSGIDRKDLVAEISSEDGEPGSGVTIVPELVSE